METNCQRLHWSRSQSGQKTRDRTDETQLSRVNGFSLHRYSRRARIAQRRPKRRITLNATIGIVSRSTTALKLARRHGPQT